MKVIKESSLSQLTDISLVEKIVNFIKSHPFPLDSDFHKFAQDNGYDPDICEQYAYALLTVIFTGGKSKGKNIAADKENKDIGDKIEIEHVITGNTDKVIKAMENVFIEKIRNDHLAETNTYYTDGVNFKNELKQEK
jgi:hypothetical protein